MKIEEISIKDIIPYENNPRKNDKAVDIVAKSIKEFGFKVPIILDKDNVIIAGHTRLKAAIKLDMKSVPVIRANELTKDQVKAFRIMDNKSNEFAEWDFDLLKKEFYDLEDTEAFDFTGFSSTEIGEIWDKEVKEDDFEIPKEPKYEIRSGEIWQLGDHRLLCGDATKKEDTNKLMNEQKPDMITTDPPYNYKEIKGAGIFKKQVMKVAKQIRDISKFNPRKFLDILEYQFVNRMNAFIFCNKDLVPKYLNFALEKGYNFNILTWHKKTFIPLGGSHHYPDTEYCIYLSKNPIFNQGLSSEHYQKYWIEDKDRIKEKIHPTAKPIKILSLHINLCSNLKGIVLDLFGGSGSTLIACEQLDRKCYMMELDPIYCSVIIERWEKLTGKKAIKLE